MLCWTFTSPYLTRVTIKADHPATKSNVEHPTSVLLIRAVPDDGCLHDYVRCSRDRISCNIGSSPRTVRPNHLMHDLQWGQPSYLPYVVVFGGITSDVTFPYDTACG